MEGIDMVTVWKKVDLDDVSTYPPIGRLILWNSYWSSISRRKTLETIAIIEDGQYYADGSLIKSGDCWAELPTIA